MMTAHSTRTLLSSVDDYLGPGDQRFFGRGFRRVEYDITRVQVTCTEDTDVRAQAIIGVRYPVDWSRKTAGRDLRPHFSTIDALVLGAQLTELCLVDAHDLDAAELRRAWIRNVRISAAAKPQEDLDQLKASVVRRRVDAVPHDPALSVSVMDCMIGTMRIRCEVEHRTAEIVPGEWYHRNLTEILGPSECRYFGDVFKSRRQVIRNIEVDRGELHTEADLLVLSEWSSAGPLAGLEADYQPSVSMVDSFVTALQLAQVMLYELDEIRREDSNTLWMRQTMMNAVRPDRPCGTGIPVSTSLTNLDLIRMGGGIWRTVDIVGELAGIQLRSAVTHRLSGRQPRRVEVLRTFTKTHQEPGEENYQEHAVGPVTERRKP